MFENESAWRADRAREFPDDPRNVRASEALYGAAEWVRWILSTSATMKVAGIRGFVEFAEEIRGWQQAENDVVIYVYDPSVTQRAGRFFFDRRDTKPTAQDFDRLVSDCFTALLESWASGWRDSDVRMTPPGSLARIFADWDVQLWDDDGDA
jgi:hypothetical protein